MKPIKISSENRDQINAALLAVNGRAKSLTVSAWWQVEQVAEKAENALAILPKAERRGARAAYIPEGPKSAYKYAATSTRLTIARKAGGWYLEKAERVDLWPRKPEMLKVIITPEQRNEICRQAVSDFVVMQGA
mgnify:CR=1 FL=1